MRITVPFGYDMVGTLGQEVLPGHNYLIGWTDVAIAEHTSVSLGRATEWDNGTRFTIWLNDKHYAPIGILQEASSFNPRVVFSGLSVDHLAVVHRETPLARDNLAIQFLKTFFTTSQRNAFRTAPAKNGRSRQNSYWDNLQQRRQEVHERAEDIAIIDGAIFVAVSEPLYAFVEWRDRVEVRVHLAHDLHEGRLPPRKPDIYYRADRHDDALAMGRKLAAPEKRIEHGPPVRIFLPSTIKAEDDYDFLTKTAKGLLDHAVRLLPLLPEAEAMCWFNLRDLLASGNTEVAETVAEKLLQLSEGLRKLPFNHQRLFEKVEQALERWEFRPILAE